ncbi:uncharacterized protein BDV17DRAFT_263438, partial [Aspergillus undulatus]|uniref:uncharacterized protein n=1 Tax=Aspergillus undulatus TaxID=1810928 RepID=UPI003CCE0374
MGLLPVCRYLVETSTISLPGTSSNGSHIAGMVEWFALILKMQLRIQGSLYISCGRRNRSSKTFLTAQNISGPCKSFSAMSYWWMVTRGLKSLLHEWSTVACSLRQLLLKDSLCRCTNPSPTNIALILNLGMTGPLERQSRRVRGWRTPRQTMICRTICGMSSDG